MYEQLEPDEREEKHDELRDLIVRRNELEERLQQYDSETGAAERTHERIKDEMDALDGQIYDLRQWFDGQFDDVVGVDPSEQEIIEGLSPGRSQNQR